MDTKMNRCNEEKMVKNVNGGGGVDFQDIAKVYNMLEDSQSKDIFVKRLNFSVTGDFQYIRDIVITYAPHLIPCWNGDFWALLASLPEDRGYVLYGAGADAATLIDYCRGDNRFVGFCSSNRKKQESGYLGQPVMSPEELLARKDLCVIISTRRARSEILFLLEEGGYPSDLIFDGPAFYDRVLPDRGQYFNPDFMTFEEEEVFVDAGCCNLVTSIELRRRCPRVKKVYAFEPDPGSYEDCVKAKEKFRFPQAKIIPYGAWSENTTLCFNARNDPMSRLYEPGMKTRIKELIEVPVMPIDEAIEAGDRVTMIKMDIEGAELEALKGAKQTIRRDKPKLAICIYHKPEDIVAIPMYIKELVPEYKLYIRHHANNASETVLYAVMPPRA